MVVDLKAGRVVVASSSVHAIYDAARTAFFRYYITSPAVCRLLEGARIIYDGLFSLKIENLPGLFS